MSKDQESSLKEWAEKTLESMGVYKNGVPNYEKLRKKVIKDLRESYSEEVLNHFLNPSNLYRISNPDGYAKFTGSCGDTIEIYLKGDEDKILQASFKTNGCIATIACGSIVTELVEGKSLSNARRIDKETILRSLNGLPQDHIHCALLASKTLEKAIKNFSNQH